MDLELIEKCFIKGTIVFCNHTNSSSAQICSIVDTMNIFFPPSYNECLIVITNDVLILVVQNRVRICIEDLDTELYCNQRAGLIGYYDIFGGRVLI